MTTGDASGTGRVARPAGSVQCSTRPFILGPSVWRVYLSTISRLCCFHWLHVTSSCSDWNAIAAAIAVSLSPTIASPGSRLFDACLQTRYADSRTLSVVSCAVRSDLPRRKAMAFTSLMMSSLIFLTASTLRQITGRCLGSR